MIAIKPEQIFGNHPLNAALKYVNDLGDGVFEDDASRSDSSDEDNDDEEALGAITLPFLRKHVPNETLRFIGYL